jgi:hypothetical protein
MISRDPSRPFAASLAVHGFYAAGPANGTPDRAEGDARRSTNTDDDTPGADRLPGGVEGESASSTPPRDHHARKSDGVEELKRMEENAEAGRD